MQYPPKKLHYKPFTLNIIIYLCPQNKISNNPIHVGLYVGFGGINQLHLLIINYLSSKYYQNTYHKSGTNCLLECTDLFTGVKEVVHWSGTKEMAVG